MLTSGHKDGSRISLNVSTAARLLNTKSPFIPEEAEFSSIPAGTAIPVPEISAQ